MFGVAQQRAVQMVIVVITVCSFIVNALSVKTVKHRRRAVYRRKYILVL